MYNSLPNVERACYSAFQLNLKLEASMLGDDLKYLTLISVKVAIGCTMAYYPGLSMH